MGERTLARALAAVTEVELARIARVADRLWAARPLAYHGHQPRRRRAGQGIEFLDYRDYAAGDEIRRVDWRATARLAQPQVRRYRDETTSDWFVCLDNSASMSVPHPEKQALALQVAASVVYLLLRRGNRVGVLLFSTKVDGLRPPGRGTGQYREVLSLLGEPPPAGAGSNLGACASRVPKMTSVFVLSDFLTPDGMRAGLRGLWQLGGEVHALQVLSERECTPPEGAGLDLEDAESGARRTGSSAPAAQQAQERLARLQGELAGFCRERAIAFSRCDTSSSWSEAVIAHLFSAHRPRA